MNKLNKIRLINKRLYLLANSDGFDTEDAFLDAIASALNGGVDIVMLKEQNKTAKKIISFGKKIRSLCSLYGALFIINGRIDIAKIVDADGVHLEQDDADVESARDILGENTIVGVSTCCVNQALKAQTDGADYIGVGPVFPTSTNPCRQATGLEYVKWASQNIDIPFFAFGGIDLTNIKEIISHGAKKIAVGKSVMNSEFPADSARLFLQEL